MTVKGYSLSAAASTQIFSSTGPFICIVSALIFVAQPGNWQAFGQAVTLDGNHIFCIRGGCMFGVKSADRWEAVLALQGFLNGLYWPATWLLLRPGSQKSPVGWLRWLPIAVYAVGSIFTQTRLNWVMILAALVAYAYIQWRRHNPMVPKLLLAAGLGLWLLLFSTRYLSDTKYFQTLRASAEAFGNRADEDTRTGQLVEFFRDVRISELVLGRGSLATWNWAELKIRAVSMSDTYHCSSSEGCPTAHLRNASYHSRSWHD